MSWTASWLLGAAIGAALVVGASGGDVDRMTFGDGIFYRYIAHNLTTPRSELAPFVLERGPSYRYGRIGLPAAAWLVSAGRPAAIRYAQPALMIASAGAVSAAAAALFPGLGLGAALAPFLALGFTLSIGGGFAEPFALALAMWAVVAARDQRWVPSAVLMALAILTRETTVLVLVGVVAWMLARSMKRGAAIVAASLLPASVWHLVVAARFGHLPLLDPYLRQEASAASPLISLWKGLTEFSAVMTVLVLVHIALAVVAVALCRTSMFGAIAAACSVQLIWSPLATWRFFGDSVRTLSFIELFFVMTLLYMVTRHASDREQSGERVA